MSKNRLESPNSVETGSSKILALPLQLTFLFIMLIGISSQWTLAVILYLNFK